MDDDWVNMFRARNGNVGPSRPVNMPYEHERDHDGRMIMPTAYNWETRDSHEQALLLLHAICITVTSKINVDQSGTWIARWMSTSCLFNDIRLIEYQIVFFVVLVHLQRSVNSECRKHQGFLTIVSWNDHWSRINIMSESRFFNQHTPMEQLVSSIMIG
jgi:hypothetical protein